MNFWWKLGVYVTILALYTAGVWHVHDWYDGYKGEKAAEVATDRAQQGQNNIIKFNQDVGKAYAKTNDKCLTSPVPVDIQRLLK